MRLWLGRRTDLKCGSSFLPPVILRRDFCQKCLHEVQNDCIMDKIYSQRTVAARSNRFFHQLTDQNDNGRKT